MAIQIINVRYITDTSDLDKAEKSILETAKATGLAEDAAKDLAKVYRDQAEGAADVTKEVEKGKKAVDSLDASAKKLKKDLDFDQVATEAKQATDQVKKLGKSVDGVSAAGKKSRGNLNFSKILNLGGSIALAGGLAGAVTAAGTALVGFGKAAISGAGDLEKAQVAFTTFLGSAEKADQVLSDLNEFSTITPFEPEQVREAGQALLAFGVESENLIDRLGRIGDLASGTGKDFNELAVIYGKARVAGTLFAEDINQLTEAGIPIIDEFAKILGVSNDQVKKLASEGKISFDTLEKAFSNLTSEGGQFAGLIAAQSRTFEGLLSTVTGQLNAITTSIGTAVLPVLKDGLQFISDLLNRLGELAPSFEPLQNAFTALRDAFNGLLDTLGVALPQFNAVDVAIKVLDQAIRAGTTGLRLAARLWTFVINQIVELIDVGRAAGAVFNELGKIISDAFNDILNFDFGSITTRISSAFSVSLSDSQKTRDEAKAAREEARKIAEEEAANAPPVPVRLPLDIQVEPADTTSAATRNKLKREQEKIAKEAEKLEAAKLELAFDIQLANAGGEGSVAGLELLRDQAIQQIQEDGAFQALNFEQQQQKLLQIRQDYARRIADVRVDLVSDEATQNLETIGNELEAALARQDQLLVDFATKESTTADQRLEKERAVTLEKINLQVQFAERALIEAQRVADANDAAISALQSQVASGDLQGSQLADAQAEIAQRLQIQSDLDSQLLAAQASFNEASLALTDDKIAQELEKEQEKADQMNELAQKISTFGSAAFNILGDVFEATTNRQLAAAEGNEEKQKEIQLKQFRRQKALQIGQTIINGAAAIINQLASTPLPAGLPFVIAIGLATVASIAKIASTQPPAFAEGVFNLQGKGTSTSDSIPAMLSKGESVMTASQTQQNYDLLRKLHHGKKLHKTRTPDGAILYSFNPNVAKYSGISDGIKNTSQVIKLEREAAGLSDGIDYDQLGRSVAFHLEANEFNKEGIKYKTLQTLHYGLGEIVKKLAEN